LTLAKGWEIYGEFRDIREVPKCIDYKCFWFSNY